MPPRNKQLFVATLYIVCVLLWDSSPAIKSANQLLCLNSEAMVAPSAKNVAFVQQDMKTPFGSQGRAIIVVTSHKHLG